MKSKISTVNPKKVYYFTNLAPRYRKLLWEKLIANTFGAEFYFLFGKNNKSGIKEIDFNSPIFNAYKGQIIHLSNVWLNKKVLLWQFGVIRRALLEKIDVAIFLGDMYCISTWIAAMFLRLRNKKVIFWGHGFYGNEGKVKFLLRRLFYKLANYHLLYNNRAKNIMVKSGFDIKKLFVIYNSLDFDAHLKLRKNIEHYVNKRSFNFFKNPKLPLLFFIGRLTPVKRLDLLIDVVSRINSNSKNSQVNLLVIGTGTEHEKLYQMVINHRLQDNVHFLGACYDENLIAKYLSSADLCVSPGNIGLTAIHSLSLGTPVCTHSNLALQMPEVEAVVEGQTGLFFEKDNIDDLDNKIKEWLSNSQDREVIRANCFKVIDDYYNPYYQLSIFEEIIYNK